MTMPHISIIQCMDTIIDVAIMNYRCSLITQLENSYKAIIHSIVVINARGIQCRNRDETVNPLALSYGELDMNHHNFGNVRKSN